MTITIVTLFPDMFVGPFDASIIKRAKEKGIVTVNFVNIRDYALDSYKTVDDHPYGGGQGMILKVDVLDRALTHAKTLVTNEKPFVILTTPQGVPYTQTIARSLTTHAHSIIICGHYEGVDERIRTLVDLELSIGDYILTGGEIPAMVIVDSVVRLLPGVFKKSNVTEDESFSKSGLEYPQYTKPIEYRDMHVPDILLSGDHKKIGQWKKEQAALRTKIRRPDLKNNLLFIMEKRDREQEVHPKSYLKPPVLQNREAETI